MGEKTEKTKAERVEQIMELLRPNTFQEESFTWKQVKEVLPKKLSYQDLSDLYFLLLCKRD